MFLIYILGRELISQQINSPNVTLNDKNPALTFTRTSSEFMPKQSLMRPSSNLLFNKNEFLFFYKICFKFFILISLPEKVARSFNNTLNYFRNSHDSPGFKKKEIIPKAEIGEEKGIEGHLVEEISKFNKLKLQKQVFYLK